MAGEIRTSNVQPSTWEKIKSYPCDVARYYWGKIKDANATYNDSDVAAFFRGDFKRAWEINRDRYFKPIAQGDFKTVIKNTVADNYSMAKALNYDVIKDPVKDSYRDLRCAVDDGTPKETASEKIVDFIGYGGHIVDDITTPVGIAATVCGAGAVNSCGNAVSTGVKKAAETLIKKGAITTAKVVSAAPAAASSVAITGGSGAAAYGACKIIAADTKDEVESGAKWVYGGLGVAALGAAAAPSAVDIAKAGGIPIKEGANPITEVFKIPYRAASTPNSEIPKNVLTHATGVIQQGCTYLREGTHEVQSQSPAREAYKFDPNGTPEQVLAKNPHVEYDATTGKYYVRASWGENVYIDKSKDYMIATYGKGNYNAIEGAEFSRTYVEPTAYNETGVKNFINPADLKPGQVIQASKASPVKFKIMPKGTKYMSAEGPATLQPDSVIMIDTKGRPYQNTVQFLVENNIGFSPEAEKALTPLLKSAYSKPVTAAIGRSPVTQRMFTSTEINDFLNNPFGLDGPIKSLPEKVSAVLGNIEERSDLMRWNNKGFGLWRAIQDPLTSTEKANPGLWDI